MVKFINCSQSDTCLEKILYFCLEKLSDSDSELFELIPSETKNDFKKHLFLCFDSEQKFDEILCLYSDLIKFKKNYSNEIQDLEVIIFCQKLFSFFLEEGESIIYFPNFLECLKTHYSITSLNGQSYAKVWESYEGPEKTLIEGIFNLN